MTKVLNPLIFLTICLIWGSSFVLMKLGLYDGQQRVVLTAYQVSAIRVLSAGLAFLPAVVKNFISFPKKYWGYCFLSGLLGVLFPAFLFCIAETRLDSSLAGTLNALTPFFVILTGYILFRTNITIRQMLGISTGMAGILILLLSQHKTGYGDISYSGFIILATICYGFNVNLVKHKLRGVSSINIVAFSLVTLIVPSLMILWISGYFSLPLLHSACLKATVASCALGVFGTAIAYALFYFLAKRTSSLFASSVSFAIPLIALAWGWVYGESIYLYQIIGLFIILGGVYLTTPARKNAI